MVLIYGNGFWAFDVFFHRMEFDGSRMALRKKQSKFHSMVAQMRLFELSRPFNVAAQNACYNLFRVRN